MEASTPATPIPLIITAIISEAQDVKTFFLSPVDGATLPYKAGQFLTFLFSQSGQAHRRSYSLSSAPAASDPLAVTVKRVENGAHSRWLIDSAAVGNVLMCTGAAGLFTVPKAGIIYPQILFFAAGIGITPIYAIIKELLHTGNSAQIVLFYSSRSQQDTVFYKELVALESRYGPQRLLIEWRFSNAKNLLQARVSKPVFAALLQQYLTAAPAAVLCYICGPEDYRWLVQLLLEEAGVPAVQIRREIFVSGRMPLPSLPPDTAAHKVTLLVGGNRHEIVVQYPETILSAAKKSGIMLPYSCAAGRCASCICQCTSGEIWMAYNEVLTRLDTDNGLVLTCTGYPVHGDATLLFE